MQGAAGDSGKVRLFDVFSTNAGKHFAVNAQLAVSAVVAGRVNTQSTEHDDENNEKREGKNTNLELLRHLTFLQAELQRLALFIIALDAPGFEQVSSAFFCGSARRQLSAASKDTSFSHSQLTDYRQLTLRKAPQGSAPIRSVHLVQPSPLRPPSLPSQSA